MGVVFSLLKKKKKKKKEAGYKPLVEAFFPAVCVPYSIMIKKKNKKIKNADVSLHSLTV